MGHLRATPAIMCRICFDLMYVTRSPFIPPDTLPEDLIRHASCSCGNAGVIFDEDADARIYVDDIRTTQRAILYHTGDFKEVRRILLRPFASELCVNYFHIKHTPVHYQPLAPKKMYDRKTSTKYNMGLIKALDRYKHATADGDEEFLRTALSDPLKEA